MNVAIIGGGPVGLFASYACGMVGFRSTVFEHQSVLGGQCTALYPDKMIYDIPGIPSIKAAELIRHLEQQANMFRPAIHLNTCIQTVRQDKGKILVNDLEFDAAIIASGFGACVFNKITLENADKYEDKQVFYNVKDACMFEGKKIAILGGGNSAADWALHCAEIASQVHIVHRRDVFTAFPASVQAMQEKSNLCFHNKCLPKRLIEQHNQIVGLELSDGTTLNVDYIIACYGMRSDSSALRGFDVQMENGKILVDPATSMTSLQNVYAVGDIAYSANKTKLFSILAGFNESAIAANHMQSMLNPGNKVQHSSDMF